MNVAFAVIFTSLFVLLLPFLFLPPSPYPIFYPYDLPAILFTFLGIALALKQRYISGLIHVAIATTNRETAVIIPFIFLCIPAAKEQRGKRLIWIFAMLVMYGSVRTLLAYAVPTTEGELLPLYRGYELRVIRNMKWLSEPIHWPIFLSTLGFLPIAWLGVSRYIPLKLRRLGLLAFFAFLPLLVLGNVNEARIYGEIVALLFLPVSAGAYRLATEQRIATSELGTVTDRHGVKILLCLLGIAVAIAYAYTPSPGLLKTAPNRWEGCILLPKAGIWRLLLTTEDRPRIELGGKTLILDSNGVGSFETSKPGYRSLVVEKESPKAGRHLNLLATHHSLDAPLQLSSVPFLVPSDKRCKNAVLRNWGVQLTLFEPLH